MSLPFYFDVHVFGAAVIQLRERGVDVIRAQDDGHGKSDDSLVLDRATELERPVVTFDDDFLREAARRQRGTIEFSGVVYDHQPQMTIGQVVEDLTLIAETMQLDEMRNRVHYLPL